MLRASFIQKRRYRGSGFRTAKHVEEECPEQMNPVTAPVSIGAGSMTFTRKRCWLLNVSCVFQSVDR